MSRFEEYLETIKSADEVLKTLKTPNWPSNEEQLLHTIKLSIESAKGWRRRKLIRLSTKLKNIKPLSTVNLEKMREEYKKILSYPEFSTGAKN